MFMGIGLRSVRSDPEPDALDEYLDNMPTEGRTFKQFYEEKMMNIQQEEGGEQYIAISGNLYMYKTLAPFCDATGFFAKKSTKFVDIGLWLIIVLQIFAPLGLLIPALANIEFGHTDKENG